MTFAAQMLPLTPEIFVLAMVCLILVVDLFLSDAQRGVTYLLSQATLVGAGALTLLVSTGETVFAFNNTFVSDPMSDLLKIVLYVAVFLVFMYSRDYLRQRDLYKGEFYVLGLFGLLGMMVLVSANNFLTIYLGLELLSLSLYAMVALRRDAVSASEAAMKYFVLGALASGMLLYGISMLYGVSGTLDLREMGELIATGDYNRVLLSFGLVFVIVGIAFKLGAVPFHMWIPDVYHGAPTAVTLYLSTAPKIAAFAMFMRVMVDGLEALHADWQLIIIILAVLSMAVGNVIAIAQANIKRMLAYSTIAHVGFLLLGLLAGTPEGYAAAMFYTIVYVLMGLGAFGMIVFLSRAGFEAERLDDFKGLNERSPWYALMVLILMFSLAGVPPFLGFWAKVVVLREVLAVELWWLAVVAVVFSIIGAFYYLRIVKLMYFDKPEDTAPIVAGRDVRFALSANSLAVLGLGMFPGALLGVCVAVLVP